VITVTLAYPVINGMRLQTEAYPAHWRADAASVQTDVMRTISNPNSPVVKIGMLDTTTDALDGTIALNYQPRSGIAQMEAKGRVYRALQSPTAASRRVAAQINRLVGLFAACKRRNRREKWRFLRTGQTGNVHLLKKNQDES